MRPHLLVALAACTAGPTIDDSAADTADSADSDTDTGPANYVVVARDAFGVPHIRSDSDEGAMYGLGWAHAADRLVQMNVFVWAVQGRMAEVDLPAAHLQSDRDHRMLGTWHHAQTVAANLPAEHQALLQAYADGVNDSVAARWDHLGPLFKVLARAPETWTPAHSIAAWWRIGDFFTSDGFGKIPATYTFDALVAEVGLEAAVEATLAGRHPGDPDAAVVQEEDVPADVKAEILAYAASLGYPGSGFTSWHPTRFDHDAPKFSHAWAVSGANTSTGSAVLVADPQVTVFWPNLLYEWQVQGASFNARGVGGAGSAGLLIGYNEHVAWGMTASGADLRDLFRLEMTGPDTYVVDGVEHTLERSTETIGVLGGRDETIEVRRSLWGPVVTTRDVRDGDAFALKGVPYSEDDRDTFVGMVAMMRARSVDDLHVAADDWRFPSANLVAADRDGDIYYTLLGAIPVRSVLSPLGGLIAQDGSSLAYDHQDVIPARFKPWVKNPARGTLHSANHRAEDGWYPLPLGLGQGSGGDTARSRQLGELLASLPPAVTPEQVLSDVQYDCANGARRDIVGIARHVATTRGRGAFSSGAQAAIGHLQPWLEAGGQMTTDAPGVFLASRIATNFRVTREFPALAERFGGGESGLALLLKTHLAGIAADAAYDVGDDTVAWLDGVLGAAWNGASAAGGRDSSAWDAAYARSGAVSKELGWFQNSMAGVSAGFLGGYTYHSDTLRCGDGQTIWSQGGQTYTQFVDLAHPDAALTVLGPGNSEGPEDDWWLAQATMWAEGGLKPAPVTPAAVAASTAVEVELAWPR